MDGAPRSARAAAIPHMPSRRVLQETRMDRASAFGNIIGKIADAHGRSLRKSQRFEFKRQLVTINYRRYFFFCCVEKSVLCAIDCGFPTATAPQL